MRPFIAITLLLVSSVASADPKPLRVVACQNFNTFKDSNGVTLGVCGAKKPGGKVTYLESFQIVTVINPATDKAERVLVGFAQ